MVYVHCSVCNAKNKLHSFNILDTENIICAIHVKPNVEKVMNNN